MFALNVIRKFSAAKLMLRCIYNYVFSSHNRKNDVEKEQKTQSQRCFAKSENHIPHSVLFILDGTFSWFGYVLVVVVFLFFFVQSVIETIFVKKKSWTLHMRNTYSTVMMANTIVNSYTCFFFLLKIEMNNSYEHLKHGNETKREKNINNRN